MVLTVEDLLERFRIVDEVTNGQLRAIPFCVKPLREFWRGHPKCTWCEILKLDSSDFDEAFSALGSTRRALWKHEIYKVNACEFNDHPRHPYGGTIAWYTYKERLPTGVSVRSYHDATFNHHLGFPPLVANLIVDCASISPVPKRRRSTVDEDINEVPPDQHPSSASGVGATSRLASPVPRLDLGVPTSPPRGGPVTTSPPHGRPIFVNATSSPLTQPSFSDKASSPLGPPETPVNEQNRRRKTFGKPHAIDPTKLEGELSDYEMAVLYALVKRAAVTIDGVETIEIPADATRGRPRPLKLVVVAQGDDAAPEC